MLVGKESNNKSQNKTQSKAKDMKTKKINNKTNGKVEKQESMRTEETSRTKANGEATKSIQRMNNYDKYHMSLFRNNLRKRINKIYTIHQYLDYVQYSILFFAFAYSTRDTFSMVQFTTCCTTECLF